MSLNPVQSSSFFPYCLPETYYMALLSTTVNGSNLEGIQQSVLRPVYLPLLWGNVSTRQVIILQEAEAVEDVHHKSDWRKLHIDSAT